MSDRTIRENIRKICGLHKVNPVSYVNGEVVTVDLSKRECDCVAVSGDVEYSLIGVKLMASIDDGFLISPTIGSTVKIIYAENIEPFICQYSEIESITIDAKTSIKFNDGSFGGLVKAAPLVEKINALEKQINDILQVLKSTVIPLAPSGSYPFVNLYAGISAINPVTKTDDLENKKVTHGE